MNKNRILVNSILLIHIVIVVLYHLFGYIGHFGFDDIHYAELASGLLGGSIDFEDHYAYRFPLVLLTALSYLIFGISDLASSLPAMAITIGILIIVFNILREHGLKVLLTGLSLTTFSNWFLFYSDKMMPDVYVALSVIWALAIIHRYRYKSKRSRTARYAFLFTLALLFGFISKGSIALMLPLLFFLLVTDIMQKRHLKFWAYSLVSGSALLAIYLFTIWLFTGNVMGRFDAIADNSYLNLCSYDQQSLRILLRRVFAGFFELSIYQALATGFIFVFAVLFQKQGLRFFRLNDSFSFFLVSAIILFLSSSFMSISLSSYSPMCLDPRHYLFLIPVASIPAARIIAAFLESRQHGLQLIIALLIVAVISFFQQGQSFWMLYLPLLGLFVIYLFLRKSMHFQYLFIGLFSAILLLIPLDMVRYAREVKYRVRREIVKEQVVEKHSDCIVITDEIQKRLLNYYTGFDKNQAPRFLSFEEFEADPALEGNKLLLLNWHTRYLSGMEPNALPYYAREIPTSNELIFENSELDLSMYMLNELYLPGQSGILLLSTCNDFEKEIPFWSRSDKDISSKTKYAGVRSNQVSGYSSTFEYPVDSLQAGDRGDLLIQCKLFCFAEDKTDAKIVVSIENSESTYIWKALEVNPYLKAYSNWWPLTFEVSVNQMDIKPGSRLKIYVWKNDASIFFIDNFGINIHAMPSS